MITYDKRCKVCQVITREGGNDSPLLRRIYDSRQFVPDGEPLTAIAEDYHADIKYLSLYNHSKKHQTLSENEVADKQIKKMERNISEAKMARDLSTKSVRDILKAQAVEKLEAGEVKGFTVSAIAKVLKDEDDVKAKEKDQAIKVVQMIEQFQSGALNLPDSAKIIEIEDFSILPEEE